MAYWSVKRRWLLPAATASLMLAAICLAYIIPVTRRQITPWLPFVRDAGGQPPQSGIFSILLFLSTMVGWLTVAVLYVVTADGNLMMDRRITVLNRLELFFGITSMCGLVIIASYPIGMSQEHDAWSSLVRTPHFIGVYLFFASGVIYTGLHNALSWCQNPHFTAMILLRSLLFLVGLGALLTYFVPTKAGQSTGNDYGQKETEAGTTITPDKDEEVSFPVHQLAEWVLFLCFIVHMFTLIGEFRDVIISVIVRPLQTTYHSREELQESMGAEKL